MKSRLNVGERIFAYLDQKKRFRFVLSPKQTKEFEISTFLKYVPINMKWNSENKARKEEKTWHKM